MSLFVLLTCVTHIHSYVKYIQVVEGQEVCVIEAMKMQNIFYAAKDGEVKDVYVKQGESVAADQLIYELVREKKVEEPGKEINPN